MYTALELYINPDLNIIIMQIRSTIIKGLGQAFIHELSEWIKFQSFSKIVLVTGLDQSTRNDSQLQNYDPFRIFCYNIDTNIKIEILRNGMELEPYVDEREYIRANDGYSIQDSIERIECEELNEKFLNSSPKFSINPGAGLSSFLFQTLGKDDQLIILSYFTNEGGFSYFYNT
jgi:hypothetical protein